MIPRRKSVVFCVLRYTELIFRFDDIVIKPAAVSFIRGNQFRSISDGMLSTLCQRFEIVVETAFMTLFLEGTYGICLRYSKLNNVDI